jgi:hypothetical protein
MTPCEGCKNLQANQYIRSTIYAEPRLVVAAALDGCLVCKFIQEALSVFDIDLKLRSDLFTLETYYPGNSLQIKLSHLDRKKNTFERLTFELYNSAGRYVVLVIGMND